MRAAWLDPALDSVPQRAVEMSLSEGRTAAVGLQTTTDHVVFIDMEAFLWPQQAKTKKQRKEVRADCLERGYAFLDVSKLVQPGKRGETESMHNR